MPNKAVGLAIAVMLFRYKQVNLDFKINATCVLQCELSTTDIPSTDTRILLKVLGFTRRYSCITADTTPLRTLYKV